MNNPGKGPGRPSLPLTRKSKIVLAICFVLALMAGVTFMQFGPSQTVRVSAQKQKRFVATRKIVVDKTTGELRLPTEEETDKLVADLSELTKRIPDGLKESSVSGSGAAVDLDNGYGGVMLARPNSDGTFESRCVFTF